MPCYTRPRARGESPVVHTLSFSRCPLPS
jgi:hypothetical protein